MSYYESPEQRLIREQRNRIERLTAELTSRNTRGYAWRRDMETISRRIHSENERLVQQLRQQQASADKNQRQMSAQVQRLDAQVKESERLQNIKIQEMQHRHAQQIQRMETEFQEEQQSLQNEIEKSRREMRRGISQLRTETDEKIQKQKEENARALAEVNNKLENKMNAVNRTVNSLARQLAEREEGEHELAVYWAQEAARMTGQIRETFQSQLLDERKIAHLNRRIALANDDIKGGQYQSAITTGREAFYLAMDMKEELTQAAMEWNYHYNALRTREQKLLQAIEEAEHRVYEIDTEEGIFQYRNGVDYWTFGQLSLIQKLIADAREKTEDAEKMTLPQLQEAEEQIRSLQEQLALVENAAHINVAMSVSRYETACEIGNILDEHYEMTDADGAFFATEDREEYHAVFQNTITNDQVAVVITPIPDDTGVVTNHVELLVGNADNNPVTRDRIARAVAEQLRNAGLENCSFPCAGRYGDATQEEVNRVSDMAAVEEGDETVRAAKPVETTAANSVVSRVKKCAQIN